MKEVTKSWMDKVASNLRLSKDGSLKLHHLAGNMRETPSCVLERLRDARFNGILEISEGQNPRIGLKGRGSNNEKCSCKPKPKRRGQ